MDITEVGAGAGAGFVYTHIDKTTSAEIGPYAEVDAGGVSEAQVEGLSGEIDHDNRSFDAEWLVGVSVQAQSTEKLVNVAVAAAGSDLVGVGGGVTYTNVSSDTTATIAAGAKVNQGNAQADAAGAQSVNVSASNLVIVTDVGGGIAIGLLDVSGAVDVGIIRNTTHASIEAGAEVTANQDVSVYALTLRRINSYALNLGAGGVGIAGSVSVWTLGDKLDSNYDTVMTNGNDALAVQDNSNSSNPAYPDFGSYADGQASRADVISAISGYTDASVQPDGNENQDALLDIRDGRSAMLASNYQDGQSTAASSAIAADDIDSTAGHHRGRHRRHGHGRQGCEPGGEGRPVGSSGCRLGGSRGCQHRRRCRRGHRQQCRPGPRGRKDRCRRRGVGAGRPPGRSRRDGLHRRGWDCCRRCGRRHRQRSQRPGGGHP